MVNQPIARKGSRPASAARPRATATGAVGAGGMARPRTTMAGFTLTELLVVFAIAAILTVVAVPAYQGYARESRRAEARNTLMTAANRQERFFADNDAYANTLTALGYPANPAPSENGHYLLSVAVTGDVYTLTATAQGAQAGDVGCATLSLASNGSKTSTGGEECW